MGTATSKGSWLAQMGTATSKGSWLALIPLFAFGFAIACDADSPGGNGPGGNDAMPTLSWSSAAQTVGEGVGEVEVGLVLNESSSEDFEVQFVVGGTAVYPDDHNLIAASVRLPKGTTSAVISFGVIDDGLVEGDETVVVELSAPPNVLLGNRRHTVTIDDNEPELTLVSPNGGEVWIAGEQESITWLSLLSGATIDVDYSIDAGNNWQVIASGAEDVGVMPWSIPEVDSVAALVRVRATDGSVEDTSDSVFELLTPKSTWFVDSSVGGDGTSWLTAFATVQEAMAAASAGDEIWVAAGSYLRDGDDDVVLAMKDGVTVMGGFIGVETQREQRDPSIHTTTLDGGGMVESVVRGATRAVLDGFVVTGGVASAAGGGIYAADVSGLTIRRCVIENNHAEERGGGLFVANATGLFIDGSRFAGNDAADTSGSNPSSGGGMTLIDTRALVQGCVLEANTANGGGGGMSIEGGAVVVSQTTIAGNHELGALSGGAVAVEHGDLILARSELRLNNGFEGGAIRSEGGSVSIRGCLIANNESSEAGGVIFASGTAVEISGSTLVHNAAGPNNAVITSHGGTVSLVNSIAWDNAPLFADGGAYAVSYSALQETRGFNDGGNLITAAPMFVDPNRDDFRLSQASPCIDVADPRAALAVDLDGNRRRDDPGMPNLGVGMPPADLGAFEFVGDTTLRLLTPNGGEVWDVGTTQSITWDAHSSIATIRIEISCDDGQNHTDVTANVAAADGVYAWDIPGPGAPRCSLRIADVAQLVVLDRSDHPFAIVSNATWFVDAGVADSGNGQTWGAAFRTIQEGVDAASFGDEVHVARGTYRAAGADVIATMKEGTDLLGGYDASTGVRDIAGNPTRIDGQGTATHVVVAADARLDGFVVENGNANGGAGPWDIHGGGILIVDVSPEIRDCVVRACTAEMHGGGIYVTGSRAAPIIVDTELVDGAARNGGCMFVAAGSVPVLTGVTFTSCSTNLGYGGAIGVNEGALPYFSNCFFVDNTAGNGGAVALFNAREAVVFQGCDFEGNEAAQNGGAIQNIGSTIELRDVWFIDNSAGVRGGAIYQTEMGTPTRLHATNGVFVGNQAWGDDAAHGGGALYMANATVATLLHCTVTANAARGDNGTAGAVYVEEGELAVINSILWGNTDSSSASGECPGSIDAAEIFMGTSVAVGVAYSDVADRCRDLWPGDGNIHVDPIFAAITSPYDLSLDTASLCIDAANGSLSPTRDIADNQRYDHPDHSGGVGDPPYADMGALEYMP